MILANRVIHDDNGTLIDITKQVNDFHSQNATIPIVAAEDKIYIGSDFPFNHKYFQFSTANAAASVASVDIYDGQNWNAAVDLIDSTDSSGATFGQNGTITWVPDREEGWNREDDTEDITELSSIRIYDKYWMRLNFSADLDAGTAITYVGHRFSNDTELASIYPELNDSGVKTRFQSGKTDWNEQHIRAAETIIANLRADGVIHTRDQILSVEQLNVPAVHLVAHTIFRAFGDDFKDNRDQAKADYEEAYKRRFLERDTFLNANRDINETAERSHLVR